jgi:hypothetical protein
MGHDASRFRWAWLDGLSPEDKARLEHRLIHDHHQAEIESRLRAAFFFVRFSSAMSGFGASSGHGAMPGSAKVRSRTDITNALSLTEGKLHTLGQRLDPRFCLFGSRQNRLKTNPSPG